MKESVVHFGKDGRLVGVLCEADASQRASGAPALIVSNIAWTPGVHEIFPPVLRGMTGLNAPGFTPNAWAAAACQ